VEKDDLVKKLFDDDPAKKEFPIKDDLAQDPLKEYPLLKATVLVDLVLIIVLHFFQEVPKELVEMVIYGKLNFHQMVYGDGSNINLVKKNKVYLRQVNYKLNKILLLISNESSLEKSIPF
jgi:hypothetical protein